MWAKATWIYKVFSSVSVFFMTLDVDNQGADCDSTADVDRHLDLGKKLLAAGQLTEALSHYHAAVEGDPDNYMTYFKRAAVYLALGRSKSALPDLENVIKKRPDFSKAREQRGNIYLKQGELDLAMIDFELVLSQDPDNHEIHSQLSMIEPVKEEINRAKMAIRMGDYHEAIESLSKAIEVCPWDATLREMRANCYEGMGELVKAIGDLRPTTKLINGNTDGHLRISHLHYKLGEADESLKEIRECLKLDPDHKKCFQHYKKVKKLVKFITDASNFISRERYSDAIFKLNAALKLESREKEYLIMLKQKICHCQLKDNKASEAIKTCTEVVQIDDSNLEALCDRGEAYLLDENYDDAIKDFHAAKNINGDFRRAHEGLERAQKLQKQAKKKDYYKILGVRRTASKPEILKAYRKLAVKWHPDHYKGDDRKKAEKMFVDVAAAKEVLTDPEKRAKFDNGEDPLDPNQQQGGQPFQWGDGGFPFGDGFNFKFHFN